MLSTAERAYSPAATGAAVRRPWKRREFVVVSGGRTEPAVAEEFSRPDSDQARRILNVVVAAIALILVAPLMLVIAILVRLTSPGPIFYCQTRVGVDRRRDGSQHWRRKIDYGGRLFTIYKFRTMYVEPEGQASQTWAKPGDPRITPLGRVLRKLRMDELPQLVNVLKGDMNVVGPRPEQPKIFLTLREQIARYPERQQVLPGITGWAQVNLNYDQDLDDVRRKLHFDLEYAQRQSALEDMRILARTVPVILFRRGAL
jgi:lipopolysaccharide/colanic/teichoic acid biosynthesis glycosyltransferase